MKILKIVIENKLLSNVCNITQGGHRCVRSRYQQSQHGHYTLYPSPAERAVIARVEGGWQKANSGCKLITDKCSAHGNG